MAIDQRDHIILVDLPNNQARAAAVLAKAKEQIPNKPVRYVVTTHHHWDHLGGIREGIAEGATMVRIGSELFGGKPGGDHVEED